MLAVVTVAESTFNPVGVWGGLGRNFNFCDTECRV